MSKHLEQSDKAQPVQNSSDDAFGIAAAAAYLKSEKAVQSAKPETSASVEKNVAPEKQWWTRTPDLHKYLPLVEFVDHSDAKH